jgi:DNA primase
VFKQQKLADLIGDHVHFKLISTGWLAGKCALCNDYKERAGFKCDDDQVVYNCWNCGTTARYEEFSGNISKKFRGILNAYGIDDSEINAVVNTAFFNKKDEGEKKITLAALTKINITTPPVKLPPKSMKLGATGEFMQYQEKLAQYLIDRKIDLLKYPFFFSLEERFLNRIIIPFYRNGNLIYWQARSIIDGEKKRYDNSPIGREAVMFNFDKLYTHSPLPLFVVEGVFDAMPFDGIAILGSKLNDAKIELLSKTSRRLVFVIDKDINGKHLAEDVLKHGWDITFAPDGASDINDAVQRFGRAWTAYQLMKNIPQSAMSAQLAINMNCR